MFTIGGGVVVEGDLSRTWGVNPAPANLLIKGDPGVAVGEYVVITIGVLNYFGYVMELVKETSERGILWRARLLDNRIRMQWCWFAGAFNMTTWETGEHPDRLPPNLANANNNTNAGGAGNVNPNEGPPTLPNTPAQTPAATGQQPSLQRYFWHILPEDWEEQKKTFTTAPMSAAQILNTAFNSAIGLPFSFARNYHLDQIGQPVFDIDVRDGAHLSGFVAQITEMQGLIMTIRQPNILVWERRGDGPVPTPTGQIEKRHSIGEALNEKPTQITVMGERDRVQVINLELEVDWLEHYEQFIAEPRWVDEVDTQFGPYPPDRSGRAALAAMARRVSLREYAKKLNDPALIDHRMWGDISRAELPVWSYVQDIVFKTYRVPTDYVLDGVAVESLDLFEGLVQAVEIEDIATGDHLYVDPIEYYPETKAFITASGQELEVLDPSTQEHFQIHHPDRPDLKDLWREMNDFRLENQHKTIQFNSPVFVPGTDTAPGGDALYILPNQSTDVDPGTDYYKITVPNPDYEVEHAIIKASLVFETRRYTRVVGAGHRKSWMPAPRLSRHWIIDAANTPQEVPYRDGDFADDKALALATPAIAQSTVLISGHFHRFGVMGYPLTPQTDRILSRITWGGGVEEDVTFAKAHGSHVGYSQTTMERMDRERERWPGEQELRKKAEDLMTESRLEKTGRQNRGHKNSKGMVKSQDLWNNPVGNHDGGINEFHDENQAYPGASLAKGAGEVVWLDRDGVPDPFGKRFGGIAVTGRFQANREVLHCSHQGIVPVLIQGPFKPGEIVGCDFGDRFARPGGDRTIGCINHTDPYLGNQQIIAYVRLQHFYQMCPFRVYCAKAPTDTELAEIGIWPGSVMIWTPDDQLAKCQIATLDDIPLDQDPAPTWQGSPNTDYTVWICFSKEDATGRIEILQNGQKPTPADDELCGPLNYFSTDDRGRPIKRREKHCSDINLCCWGDGTLSGGSNGSGSTPTTSGSGSGGSGGPPVPSGSSGGPKSTAIVPAAFHESGYAALFVEESSEVRFHHMMFVDMGKGGPREKRFIIDWQWLSLVEDGTARVGAHSADRGYVGARVEGSELILTAPWIPWIRPRYVTIELTGIRKGFRDVMLPSRTEAQFLANEEFIASAYPGADESPAVTVTPEKGEDE